MNCVFLLTALVACCINASTAEETKQSPGQQCPVVLPPGSTDTQLDCIVNGTAPTGDLQQHMVQFSDGLRSVCTGSLLSDKWVLTAAHCNVLPGFHFVFIGGRTVNDGERIKIRRTINHPSFNRTTFLRNDIALVLLAAPAPVGSKFVLVNSVSSVPADYAFLRVAGYGVTLDTNFPESGELLQVDVPTTPTNICSAQLTAQGGPPVSSLYYLCAGYEQGGCGPCQGDSGGPLFLFDASQAIVQVGITSFGVECANPRSPGVYTRLSSYVSWMLETGAVFATSTDGQNVFLGTPEPSTPSEPQPSETQPSEPQPSEPQPSEPQPSEPQPSEPQPSAPSDSSPPVQPSPGPSSELFGDCFAANARVTLKNGSTKTMEELLTGDLVQVSPGLYSEVFMFTHRVSSDMREFIYSYSSASNTPLAITAGHFLPVNSAMVEAKNARVGDMIQLGNGGTAEITRVELRKGRGLYNPQTLDGRIVVDGVVASTYTKAIEMGAAHALLTPLRYLFRIFGRTDVSFGVLEKGGGRW